MLALCWTQGSMQVPCSRCGGRMGVMLAGSEAHSAAKQRAASGGALAPPASAPAPVPQAPGPPHRRAPGVGEHVQNIVLGLAGVNFVGRAESLVFLPVLLPLGLDAGKGIRGGAALDVLLGRGRCGRLHGAGQAGRPPPAASHERRRGLDAACQASRARQAAQTASQHRTRTRARRTVRGGGAASLQQHRGVRRCVAGGAAGAHALRVQCRGTLQGSK